MSGPVMSSPRVVICGTNFTFAATVACEGAALLCRHFGARLVLAHVVEPGIQMEEAPQRLQDHARERLAGIQVTTALLRGHRAHELAGLARRERADLLVIGVHQGREPLVPLSIEAALAAEAPCPVVSFGGVEDAHLLIERLEGARRQEPRCTVCGLVMGALVCATCSRRIAFESMEHKWAEELREGPGLLGLSGARGMGPMVGPLEEEGARGEKEEAPAREAQPPKGSGQHGEAEHAKAR